MKNLFLLFLFFLLSHSLEAQDFKAQKVKGLPSEEVYDLLADSKGFIWVAHSLGISRYDGVSFTNFHHPQEMGSGVTDLLEDKQGRIWLHNFNGQIFYIENEEMHLLAAYKSEDESSFPRLAILGDELVASSDKGLFICNTSNLECKYLFSDKGNIQPRSLATVGNIVYQFDGLKWISYSPQQGIREMPFLNRIKNKFDKFIMSPVLQPIITLDTIYSKFSTGNVLKFVVRDNRIELVDMSSEKSFINAITKYNDQIWIHTKTESHTVNNTYRIKNYNLTEIVVDREGNTWYGSLEKGLWVLPKSKFWQESFLSGLKENDFIRSELENNQKYIYGTQNGNVIIKNAITGKSETQYTLPSVSGAIENILKISDDGLLIAPSVGLYFLNTGTNQISLLSDESTLKSVAFETDTLFAAYSRSLSIIDTFNRVINRREAGLNAFIASFKNSIKNQLNIRNNRCYAVCFDTATSTAFAAFNDGLYRLNHNKFESVLFNGNKIAATSLLSINENLFIGSLNNGIFKLHNGRMKNINTSSGLLSNNILKLKWIGGQLFIVEPDNIQVMDSRTGEILKTINLPANRSGLVYDLWKEDSLLYVTTNKNLFSTSLKSFNSSIIPVNYLLSFKANDSAISTKQYVSLPYFRNEIQFTLASPTAIYPEITYFKYRLLNNNDTSWLQTSPSQRTILFTSLQPGHYIFEAYAVNFQNNPAKPIRFTFQILNPWWKEIWFYILVSLVLISLLFFLIRWHIQNVKRHQQELIERLHLKNELRKSLLSTIKAQMNPHFIFNCLNAIQSYVYTDDKKSASKYLGKFSDLVRNILDNSNKNEISLSHEIELLHLYLDLEKVRFENDLNVQFDIAADINTEQIFLPPMLVQPYIENAIVHGLFHKKGSRNLVIQIKPTLEKDYIEISIDDNGIGRKLSHQINSKRKNHISFSNSANENRIELINQTLERKIKVEIIDKKDEDQNAAGTTVKLCIPILDLQEQYQS